MVARVLEKKRPGQKKKNKANKNKSSKLKHGPIKRNLVNQFACNARVIVMIDYMLQNSTNYFCLTSKLFLFNNFSNLIQQKNNFDLANKIFLLIV